MKNLKTFVALKREREKENHVLKNKERLRAQTLEIRESKGITLIALVVTIVVLLILAGITITALFGDNGLITRAKIADKKTQEGAQKDIDEIENLGQQVNTLVNGGFTDIYVTLYTDGTLGFSNNTETIEGKTVQTSYGNIKNQRYFNDMNTTDEAQFPPWSENESIQTVVFTNEIVPKSTSCWFALCENLTEIQNISNLNTSKVTDMSWMFAACGISELDLSNFNTSQVTDMSHMFYAYSSLTNLDVSNFNTSQVTDMSMMFAGCARLTSLNVSNFDTSKVTNMNEMFSACASLTSLDVSNFDTSKVTDISWMFEYCSSLTSLNASNFNTSQVTDMRGIFRDCSNLTSLNLSNFNTIQVTDMAYMFSGCTNLTSLDLTAFNTSQVKDMESMFQNCENLTTIYASSNFVTTDVTYSGSTSMFEGCSNLVGGNGTAYNSSYIRYEYARIDAAETPGYFTSH